MLDPRFKSRKAQRTQCKASIMIEGLTGKGKSGLALMLAYTLANEQWDKVHATDTENKSLDLFVGIPFSMGGSVGEFNVINLTADIGFKPEYYILCRETAIQENNLVHIADSISHAWQYKGGVLDLVAEAKTRTKGGNDKYAAWGDPEVMAEKNRLLEILRDPRIHVITTVRVKEKFDYETDSAGKKTLVSLGEQQIQQADLKYEPDLVLSMVSAGHGRDKMPVARVIKSRYAIFEEGQEYTFTPKLCQQLKDYLNEGADPEVLLEQQRQDYLTAITEYLDTHPTARTIWPVLKEQAGYKDAKLSDIPLAIAKALFITLTS